MSSLSCVGAVDLEPRSPAVVPFVPQVDEERPVDHIGRLTTFDELAP